MSLFPDNPSLAADPYVWRPRFKTFVAGPFDNENIVTRAGIQFGLHSATIRYYQKTYAAVAKAVYEFFMARRGRYDSFAFYDLQGWDNSPAGIIWTNCYVGVGNASTLVFDLTAHNANADANRKIYCDGVDKTANGSWAQGTGADGRDRFTFSTYTPTAGQVITCDFLGRRVWKSCFTTDGFDIAVHDSDFYEITVDLIEIP